MLFLIDDKVIPPLKLKRPSGTDLNFLSLSGGQGDGIKTDCTVFLILPFSLFKGEGTAIGLSRRHWPQTPKKLTTAARGFSSKFPDHLGERHTAQVFAFARAHGH